jgi:hypothetical protein
MADRVPKNLLKYWLVDAFRAMVTIDSRDDPAHEELDVCTKGNNDDTLLHVLIYF